jgi:hypothetical protein
MHLPRFGFLAVAAVSALSLGPSAPPEPAPQTPAAGSTTIDDRVDLSLTVYNSSLALVRDVRAVRLRPGTFDLQFMDVAATVNPATVHFRSLTDPSRVSVVEQNYEYDLLEPDKLLRKYVGRDVTIVRTRQAGGSTAEELVKARLLSYNAAPVWQIGNDIVTGLHPDHIRFPDLPGNLYSRPTLIWTLDNGGAADHRIETSYLAGQLSWNADYVLTVGRDERKGDLDGWVTLTNASGTAFGNAKLQLVAGDLNRVQDAFTKRLRADGVAESVAMPQAAMSREAFAEYHLYTLERRTSINNNETKQVSMLASGGVPVAKRYVVNGQAHWFRSPIPGAADRPPVEVFYQFRNDEQSGLGMPLPAGVVRVYQADSKGGIQFAGEDRIRHTPKDETLNLKIGNAFDVVAERKQTDFQKIAPTVYETEFEITLRNHKAVPVRVEVNEPIGGTWSMLRASHEWTKTAVFAAQFVVPVGADSTVVLKYRVRATY